MRAGDLGDGHEGELIMSWKAIFNNPVEPFAEVGTFEHEGRSFSAGGAFYDPERGLLMGYPMELSGSSLALHRWELRQWDGTVITPLRMVRRFRGGFGRTTMYAWSATYDGRVYSGRNAGPGMLLRMRAKALR